jgi:hypothetical protein
MAAHATSAARRVAEKAPACVHESSIVRAQIRVPSDSKELKKRDLFRSRSAHARGARLSQCSEKADLSRLLGAVPKTGGESRGRLSPRTVGAGKPRDLIKHSLYSQTQAQRAKLRGIQQRARHSSSRLSSLRPRQAACRSR